MVATVRRSGVRGTSGLGVVRFLIPRLPLMQRECERGERRINGDGRLGRQAWSTAQLRVRGADPRGTSPGYEEKATWEVRS